jgi:hypothetical protein
VDLRHYRLPPDSLFSSQPTIDHPVDFNFGNRLRLLGYSQTDDQQVTLFWEALEPLDEDYRVSLVLQDTMGQSWGQWDGRPSAYFYPTDRWRVGQVVFGRYDLTAAPGTPPGDYGLEVGIYTEEDPVGLDLLDPAGAPQGKKAVLGAVRLSVSAASAEQVEIPHRRRIDLGDGLTVLGWDLSRDQAQPGDRLALTLVWSAETQPQDDYGVRVLVTDATGQTLDAGTFAPTNTWHPTSIWQAGQAWRGQAVFRLPIQVQPGEAHLSLQLVESNGLAVGQPAELTAVQVAPAERVYTAPEPEVHRASNFANKIALVGADLGTEPVTPGETLQVVLYWQALADMDIPHSVFVHLLDADGQVVAGHDGEPAGGARPTTGWVPGEFVLDSHELAVPVELPPGEYVIEVGLYDAGTPGMPRLPVLSQEGEGETDRVILGPVQVR